MPEGPRKTKESSGRGTGSNLCIPRRVFIVYFFVTSKGKRPGHFCNVLQLRRRHLTPLRIITFGKLIIAQSIKRLQAFYGFLRFITVFTRGGH
jgi:hypothetical protein